MKTQIQAARNNARLLREEAKFQKGKNNGVDVEGLLYVAGLLDEGKYEEARKWFRYSDKMTRHFASLRLPESEYRELGLDEEWND